MKATSLGEVLSGLRSAGITLTISELGCGLPIAHNLMKLDGASKVVMTAVSFYSKEAQQKQTNLPEDVRSVSKEAVHNTLMYLLDTNPNSLAFAYSLQAGFNKTTHGFIGIGSKDEGVLTNIYHFTLPGDWTKVGAGDYVEQIFIQLINIYLGEQSAIECYRESIDGAWYGTGHNGYNMLFFKPSMLPEKFGTFGIKDGKWIRLTELIRACGDNICLIKGTFNPLHDGHRYLREIAFQYSSTPFLCTTTYSFDGKTASVQELVERATTNGTTIIDSNNIKMIDLINDILVVTRTSKPIHLFMGIDVFTKFDLHDINGKDVHVHVLFRECTTNNVTFYNSDYATLSSTQIRNQSNEVH